MAKRIRKSKAVEDVVMFLGWQAEPDAALKAEMDAIQSDLEVQQRRKGARITLIKTKVGNRNATGFVAVKGSKGKRKRGKR